MAVSGSSHTKLDADIDKNLIYNIMMRPETRQLLSYLYLLADRVLGRYDTGFISEYNRFKNEDDIKYALSVYSKNLVENLYELGLLRFGKSDSVGIETALNRDDIVDMVENTKTRVIFTDPFNFIDEDNKLYITDPDTIYKLIGRIFPGWTKEKLLDTCHMLRGVKCIRYPDTIHQIINLIRDVDGNELIIFPYDTYRTLLKLGAVTPELFNAERRIRLMVKRISAELQKMKDTLAEIFPPYISNKRSINTMIKKALKNNKEDIIGFMLDEMEDPYPIIEEPQDAEARIDYSAWRSGVNQLLKAVIEIENIKGTVTKIYDKYFGDRATLNYAKLIEDVKTNRRIADKILSDINSAFESYSKIVIPKEAELINFKIAYHKHEIARLEKEKMRYIG